MKKILMALFLLCASAATLTAQDVSSPPKLRGTWITAVDYGTSQNPVGIQYAIITFVDSTFASMMRYVEDDTVWVVAGFERPVEGVYSTQSTLGESVLCVKRLTVNPLSSLTNAPGYTRCQRYDLVWVRQDGEYYEVLRWGSLEFSRPTDSLLRILLSADAKSK